MGLFGQVYGFTDDVVLAVLYPVDNANGVIPNSLYLKMYAVTNGDRIGAFNPLNPEFALDPALVKITVARFYVIPTPSRFVYRTRHLN